MITSAGDCLRSIASAAPSITPEVVARRCIRFLP
jgi:hypothetical protein